MALRLDIVVTTAIFVVKVNKITNLKMFESQYISDFLRYRPEFLHVIITLKDFKVTFSNMGPYSAPSFISEIVS